MRIQSYLPYIVLHVFFILFSGVLQKGQQWEVHFERPAGCSNAKSFKIPPSSAGRPVEPAHFTIHLKINLAESYS